MQNLYNPDPESMEPLLTVGGLTTLATTILTLVVAFGLPLSGAQTEAILGVIAAVAPFVVAVAGRRRVYSPATVARLLRR